MKLLSNMLVFVLLLAAAGVQAELPAKKVLTLSAAKEVGLAAEAEAQRRGATVVIAVVDDGGHLLLLERLDDTQVASSEVAIGKARTAAIFRRPSKVFEDQVREVAQHFLGPFLYTHLGSLATIGRKAAVAEFGWIRLQGTGAWCWLGYCYSLFATPVAA